MALHTNIYVKNLPLIIRYNSAFTLIELSIVLVIIGLLIGGVLVGRDLVEASKTRSQVKRLEEYKIAFNNFKLKYNNLPGDIPEPHATGFGFAARGFVRGQGDGNGYITGSISGAVCHFCNINGESLLFWRDLATANLISGSYNNSTATADITAIPINQINGYFPSVKISSSGKCPWSPCLSGMFVYGWRNVNYISLSGVFFLVPSYNFPGSKMLTVKQANAIDAKIDDGYPQSGSVFAADWAGSSGFYWADGTEIAIPPTTAVAGSVSTCFDNNNVAGVRTYSVRQNDGREINCSLSFKLN